MLMLLFCVGEERYACDCAQVVEILPQLAVRSVIGAPPFVIGLFAYRGQSVPLVDFAVLTKSGASHQLSTTRIILFRKDRADGKTLYLGLIADYVTDTINCDPTEFKEMGPQPTEVSFLVGTLVNEEGSAHLLAVTVLFERLAELYLAPGTTPTSPILNPDPSLGVIVFRVGQEHFALSSNVVGQITEKKPVHRIPHQFGKILKGIVSIHGQLRLFVSLAHLLDLDEAEPHAFLMIEKEGEVWVFAVSEVYGLHRCDLARLQGVSVSAAKPAVNYLKGFFFWGDKTVGLLEEELLFFGLRRGIL